MAGKNIDLNEIGEGINDINITPFVDVVLVLLVIFMVATPIMVKDRLNINLPKTLTADVKNNMVSIGLAVTKEGQILFNGELLSDELFTERLHSIYLKEPNTQFLISADADSKHRDVVKVIDMLKKNNLNSFALQVEKIK